MPQGCGKPPSDMHCRRQIESWWGSELSAMKQRFDSAHRADERRTQCMSQRSLFNWCRGIDDVTLIRTDSMFASHSTSLLNAICLGFCGFLNQDVVHSLRQVLLSLFQGEMAVDLMAKLKARWMAEGVSLSLDQALDAITTRRDTSRQPSMNFRTFVYAMAHVCKRPIMLFSDDKMGEDNFGCGGLYLPLNLPSEQCNKLPLVLAYVDGHFFAVGSTGEHEECLLPVLWGDGTAFRVHFALGENLAQRMDEYLLLVPHETQDGITPCCKCSFRGLRVSGSMSPGLSDNVSNSSAEDASKQSTSEKLPIPAFNKSVFNRIRSLVVPGKSEMPEINSPTLQDMISYDNNHALRGNKGNTEESQSPTYKDSGKESSMRRNCSDSDLHSKHTFDADDIHSPRLRKSRSGTWSAPLELTTRATEKSRGPSPPRPKPSFTDSSHSGKELVDWLANLALPEDLDALARQDDCSRIRATRYKTGTRRNQTDIRRSSSSSEASFLVEEGQGENPPRVSSLDALERRSELDSPSSRNRPVRKVVRWGWTSSRTVPRYSHDYDIPQSKSQVTQQPLTSSSGDIHNFLKSSIGLDTDSQPEFETSSLTKGLLTVEYDHN